MAHDTTNGKIAQYKNLLLCVDGGCEPKNPGGIACCGWVIYHDDKILVEEGRVLLDGGDLATNNYAEYCGLGFSLKWLRDQNWRGNLTIQADSQLLIYQVGQQWKCKAKHLQPMRQRIFDHLAAMNLSVISEDDPVVEGSCILKWVRREFNSHADSLCEMAYNQHRYRSNPPPSFVPLGKK